MSKGECKGCSRVTMLNSKGYCPACDDYLQEAIDEFNRHRDPRPIEGDSYDDAHWGDEGGEA